MKIVFLYHINEKKIIAESWFTKGYTNFVSTFFLSTDSVDALPLPHCDNVTIVSRNAWGARPSKAINYMGTPVTVVFIHHTAMSECFTKDECAQEMKTIQNLHMDTRGKCSDLIVIDKVHAVSCQYIVIVL
jgi:formylmethanofuran dehydrogenase subunit D